jgi:hypothetical protein
MAKEKTKKEPIVALDPIAQKLLDDQAQGEGIDKSEKTATENDGGVLGAIVKALQTHSRSQVERMAFEVDPKANYQGTSGYYRLKQGLTPDHIIKRIMGPQGDDLVCQILQARSNILSAFGRPRTSRFSTGFEFQPLYKSFFLKDEKEKAALQDRIESAKKKLFHCGGGDLEEEFERPTLSQFIKLITRDGLGYGRFAVERIYKLNPKTAKKELYAFRASDGGTIYKLLPNRKTDQSVRAEALRELQRLKDHRFDVEKYKKDEYKWVQVIDGKPVQAFSESEMIVYNLYPVTNVEYNGYPLTPIDQSLNAITTHINITMHNKLYFQNGRAARGMLVFRSDTIDEGAVQKIRLQFHQSINSVQNAWRMPVFAVGSEDNVEWQSIDIAGRDAEFQYLMDNNARVILSAFQMSPEELPGYAHLARGTNTQSLAEADNEWKLTAARDVGLRPLMSDIQDFLNKHILPEIDADLAKTHQIVLAGLDKDSPEKESTRLAQDMPIHMSYNEVLEHVEKDPVPTEMGGDFPLNPQFQMTLDKYMTVGEILENFFGRKEAGKDPRYQYVRDPFWMQYQQMMLQKAQLALQQQMMMQQQMMQQQQAIMGGGQESGHDGGQGDGQDGGNSQDSDQNSGQDSGQSAGQSSNLPNQSGPPQEIAQKNQDWATQNYMVLEKAIQDNHNFISKTLLKRHKDMVNKHLKEWAKKSKETADDLEDIFKEHEHKHDDKE